MKKFTLFLMSLFLAFGAMAQELVLELTADQIGTTYPKQLSDDDAAKVFALSDLTVAVKIQTAGTSGRRGLFVTSDPTKAKNTAANGTNPYYVAYGLNAANLSYLASWREGDRFSGNAKFTANSEVICVYVINPTNGKCELYYNGALDKSWSGTNPNGFMTNYEIVTPKMLKEDYSDAKIYIGGGKHSGGNGEVFDGTITGVKVYSGALTAAQIAAISFEDPALLAEARANYEAAQAAAQAILDESEFNIVKAELPLQVTDATASYYLWSNAPEPNEGHIKYLVDGGVGSYKGNEFFHTQWSNPVPAGPHYIEVDLGTNALSEFSFGYNTRNFDGGADFPYTIKVLASNDKENYKEIYTATGLPASGNKRWDSETIEMGAEYRYIRFNVTETKTQNRTYWHMSEFDMFTTNTSIADKYKAVVNEVSALKNVCDANASVNNKIADLNNAAADINAAVEAVNAGLPYTLAVSDAGYATLMLGYNTIIPSSVEAYTVSAVNDGYVTLTQVQGVLPAQAPILVKANAGEHYFNKTTEASADLGNNWLEGTLVDAVIQKAEGWSYYVLGVVDGEVGFYNATLGNDETQFKNAANKAYLLVQGKSTVASYSFRFPGTTGISEVKGENGEVKAIFDLTGRKVNEITAPGIYIVNGKKVLVK